MGFGYKIDGKFKGNFFLWGIQVCLITIFFFDSDDVENKLVVLWRFFGMNRLELSR